MIQALAINQAIAIIVVAVVFWLMPPSDAPFAAVGTFIIVYAVSTLVVGLSQAIVRRRRTSNRA